MLTVGNNCAKIHWAVLTNNALKYCLHSIAGKHKFASQQLRFRVAPVDIISHTLINMHFVQINL